MKAVEMEGITKRFPGVLANDNISLTVEKQTVHCLLGENGSGKTTLMNILFGLYEKDAGQIFINEQPVSIHSPADAGRYGIGMVHQHFMLVNQLTVWENVVLGKEPGTFTIDRALAKQRVQQIVDKYGFMLDIDAKAMDLSIGMKQRAEIVKLLYKGADIIIFDEPTAVLTPQETDELFHIFDGLVEKGHTILFITHKLNEIFKASDTVTVLRKGRVEATMPTKACTPEQLSSLMVGHSIRSMQVSSQSVPGESVLSLEHVQLLPKASDGVTFEVRRGEIVGVAGVDGNGQMELEETIIGLRKPEKGSIRLCGKEATRLSVASRKKLGLGYIPSDRWKNGILAKLTVKENFLLGYQDDAHYRKGCFLNDKALESDAEAFIRDYEIKTPSWKTPVSSLSGGNQQKVVLAREVSKDVPFVLAAQPIRGLDIGAIEYVHSLLLDLRGQQKGILLISAELSELLDICDRIVVLSGGSITASFARADFSEEKIGLAMMGGKAATKSCGK